VSNDLIKHVKIAATGDGRWIVRVFDDNGLFEHEHFLDAQPTVETVRTLIEQAEEHHDALERLVHR
jgi:hypothetical protein